jgi:hypothetical protein
MKGSPIMLSDREELKCYILYAPDYTTFLKRQNHKNGEQRNDC